MATRQITVAYDHGGTEKTATVEADKTEEDRDGVLRLYDDGTEVATFRTWLFVAEGEHFEG
jgi:hypothetical protein